MISRLTGRIAKRKPCPVTADSIARTLIQNARYSSPDKAFSRDVNCRLKELRNPPSADCGLTAELLSLELKQALGSLKWGKAPGPDNIHAEQLLSNAGPLLIEWLRCFLSRCFSTARVSLLWKRANVVAILKPHKPSDDLKSYRPISLVCAPLCPSNSLNDSSSTGSTQGLHGPPDSARKRGTRADSNGSSTNGRGSNQPADSAPCCRYQPTQPVTTSLARTLQGLPARMETLRHQQL